jgi:holin-like protein
MLLAITIILLCQLAGEAIARGLDLPLPGPVLGMAFLFALLLFRDRLRTSGREVLAGDALESVGLTLLAHLSLLFVPAGVGVVQRLDVLSTYGAALLAALVVSTVTAMLVAVGIFRLVARLSGQDTEAET